MTSGEEVEISHFTPPPEGGDHGGWVNTTPTSDSEAPEAIIQLPESSDAVDAEDPHAYAAASDGVGISGQSCRCTKKRLGLMLLATTALLALAIGLGVGLGARKSGASDGAQEASASQAAMDAVALAECLEMEEEGAAVDAASDPSHADGTIIDAPTATFASDVDLSSYSNDFEDAAPGTAEGSNDGGDVQVVSLSETSNDVSKLMTAVSLRRATNDSGDDGDDGAVRRRKLRVGSRTGSVANEVVADLDASSAKARRMKECAKLIEEANGSS